MYVDDMSYGTISRTKGACVLEIMFPDHVLK